MSKKYYPVKLSELYHLLQRLEKQCDASMFNVYIGDEPVLGVMKDGVKDWIQMVTPSNVEKARKCDSALLLISDCETDNE